MWLCRPRTTKVIWYKVLGQWNKSELVRFELAQVVHIVQIVHIVCLAQIVHTATIGTARAIFVVCTIALFENGPLGIGLVLIHRYTMPRAAARASAFWWHAGALAFHRAVLLHGATSGSSSAQATPHTKRQPHTAGRTGVDQRCVINK